MMIAGLTGLIFGVLLSIPVGPINLTIMNEGARRGFKWAALIGVGATVMEVLYCTIAFTGFASFFGNRVIKASMELLALSSCSSSASSSCSQNRSPPPCT